ncbi:MAG: type II toxin-antitoxin system VapC family toxin [Chloroflexi bacterium]|nr:MAG: type II toxin-antitoxin system VapC family toxin [Chloroflexota bacterium]
MTVKYLLDTNILSEPLRPAPHPNILAKLYLYQDQLATTALVWHELWFGAGRLPDSARKRAIEGYLTEVVALSIPILPYDQKAAVWHARERVRLAGLGRTPPFVDGQIAAIAKTNDLVLVTINQADFQFFDVKIEDWRE